MAVTTAKGLPVLDRVPPVGLVLTSITSIQFGAALAATLFDRFGPAGTLLLRSGFAAIILVAIWRPRVRGRSTQALWVVALFGFALGAMNLLFYESLDRIPLAVAVTIQFAGPLSVAVATSRRPLDLLWAVLAAVGIIALSNPLGNSIDTVGFVLALASAACWAAYILVGQRMTALYDGSDGLALAMVVATCVTLVPGVLQGGAELLHPTSLLLGIGVALMCSVIPYTFEIEALRRLPPRVFGILMSLEQPIAVLAGFVVLGQSLGARDLAAMSLVVVACVGVSRTARPQAQA